MRSERSLLQHPGPDVFGLSRSRHRAAIMRLHQEPEPRVGIEGGLQLG